MDVIISMALAFLLLIFSVYREIFIGYPLILCFFIFFFTALKRGHAPLDIIKMSYKGGKKSFIVLKIFVLIGAITGIWMASGTVPGIVYYGIKLMNPKLFILYAFLISSFVSFLLGTSLGTVSTVGIALIVIAKGGNINVNMAAGAIIAGAYFGDRCSPMSSSANLVANLTDTELYKNIKNMFKTSLIPFMISVLLYYILSQRYPLSFVGSRIDNEIINVFTINWIVLLPALIILVLSLFKVDVKISMLISIITAAIISILLQDFKLFESLKFMGFGFKMSTDSPLKTVIKGGGILSMYKPSLVVFISCSLAGIFDGTNMLKSIEAVLSKVKTSFQLFLYTALVSIFTAGFGCNQSISIVLTSHLMKKTYEEKKVDKYGLALDIEDTSVLLAALIPWNIAALVPTTTMSVSSSGFIPYAFYLYLLPLINLIYFKLKNKELS